MNDLTLFLSIPKFICVYQIISISTHLHFYTFLFIYPFRDSESRDLYDDNGFVHMGDLGYYDQSGTLFFRF